MLPRASAGLSRVLLAAFLGTSAAPAAPVSSPATDAAALTPVPLCPDQTRPISRLTTEELGRAKRRAEGSGVGYSPFEPSIAAAADGTLHLVWAPEYVWSTLHTANDGGWGALSGVHSRILGPNGWAEETPASGDESRDAYHAYVTSVGPDDWIVYWTWPSLVGRRLSGGVWSKPHRLTDHDDLLLSAEVVGVADGDAQAFSIDGRERHFVPSLIDPRPSFAKIFMRRFDDPPSPPEQVTPPGMYDATLMTSVRHWLNEDLEVVFFKHQGKSEPTRTSGYNDLYLTRRLKKRWTHPVALLTWAHGDREETIHDVLAFRDGEDRLIVVYAGGNEVRVLGRDRRNRRTVTTLARAVGTVFGESPPLAAAIGPDGIVSIVYLAEAAGERGGGRRPALGGKHHALFLVRTDGASCLDAGLLTDRVPMNPLFDVAVDAVGRSHVVYVEYDGSDAVLMHTVIDARAPMTQGARP